MAAENSRVTINRSVASGNAFGFQALLATSGATAELNCKECVSSNNSYGFAVTVLLGLVATIRVSHSTATNNTSNGFVQFGGVFESLGNNLVRGNPGGDTAGTITVITGAVAESEHRRETKVHCSTVVFTPEGVRCL